MFNFVKTFLTDESGATAIEYGLIAALVSVAAIGALTSLGGSLEGIFGVADKHLKDAATAADTAGGGTGGTGGT
ncbi:Flp family type IVb pilin [Kiloniella sp. EL199]|uniref:Flp family type IVb pilin n=1 Tax=Kiloniella sp. EL199 TaxID=2107581 RepID=UPI000EA02309|nr:Flp family type IVb pilin [Kiloniella sp. EL199]